MEEAIALGHKDLDRPSFACDLMGRVTRGCRSNSKLPELMNLLLSRSLVTVPLGAMLLNVTPIAVA